ncbi:MAG TPA: hypothetical protein EYP35_04245 [Desulfobacterales bacterium]|nr:hypothetical protein [Desulfobacterales bacterium]HIP39363.1 hypothetical protein [Desulfocapsa sulfexigens]
MSYILEALKKSDKERQRDEIPDLQADHSLPPVRREKRKPSGSRLPVVIVLVFLCFVGIFLWQSGGEKEVHQAKDPLAVSESVVPAPAASSPTIGTSEKPAVAVQKTQPVTEKKKQVSRVARQATVSVSKTAAPATATIPEKKTVVVAKKPAKTVSRPEEIVPLMEDLPVVIRAGLPDLTFAGHVYAEDPRKRLIIINNRIVREGDIIASGLSLERISSHGVVLRYKTTVFRVILF